MASLVLDASAALRVILDPQREGPWLERIGGAVAVYAPGLIVAETANALRKYIGAGHLTEDSAQRLHADALALVDRTIADRDLFPEALALASRFGHPVYDALYVIAARRTASAILTRDKRLAALARRADVAIA